MKSISFPKMLNKNSTKIVTDHDAVMQNLKVLLSCEQGQFKDDPYYGVTLKKYLFNQNNFVLQDILIDCIYTQIADFMPQLRVTRKNITIVQNGIDLYCNILAINLLDFTTDMYSIVLLKGDTQ